MRPRTAFPLFTTRAPIFFARSQSAALLMLASGAIVVTSVPFRLRMLSMDTTSPIVWPSYLSIEMVKRLDRSREHFLTSLQFRTRSAGLTLPERPSSRHSDTPLERAPVVLTDPITSGTKPVHALQLQGRSAGI